MLVTDIIFFANFMEMEKRRVANYFPDPLKREIKDLPRSGATLL